jgi:hypothetical protein
VRKKIPQKFTKIIYIAEEKQFKMRLGRIPKRNVSRGKGIAIGVIEGKRTFGYQSKEIFIL